MTYKIIDTREKRAMTEKQGEAIMRAYERFDTDATTIKTPQKEHLDRSYREAVCCGHAWQPIPPTEEGTKLLQKVFEETDIGDHQKICSVCGALSLWERGELWAYDAIFNAKKPEEKPDRKPSKRERR